MSRSKNKTARIITIGDEIVTGKIIDTNGLFISKFLFKRGYKVSGVHSIPDDPASIKSFIREGIKKDDLVITTGGLGPTHDDITKKAVCQVFKCKTKLNPKRLKELERRFEERGRKLPESSRDYAFIPTSAVAVDNPTGVAPGLFFDKKVLLLPGVPLEMRSILETYGETLIPRGGAFFMDKVIRTGGAGETTLSDKMHGLDNARGLVDVAFLPHSGRVDLRMIARGNTTRDVIAKLEKAEKFLKVGIEEHIWGYDDETIESVIGKKLTKKKESMAIAESCTGGGIGALVTSAPGSSKYFYGGFVTYSNIAKHRDLSVPFSIIERHGAVSQAVAIAMARLVREKFKSSYGISATGIAGPGGGTEEKPVGLVYIAVSSEKGDKAKKLFLGDNREIIRERTAFESLYLLYKNLI